MSRETLYSEVWADPMTTVAQRYGVSGSFLTRVCSRLNVPTPRRGYWARIRFGASPRAQPPLPAARPGDELDWARGEESRRLPGEPPRAPETAAPPVVAKPPARRPRHELVDGVRDLFMIGHPSRLGYLRPNKKLLVDIFTTAEELGYALDSARALFLALEERGHRVLMAPNARDYHCIQVDPREKPQGYAEDLGTWRPARPTIVMIGTVAIGLGFHELSENVEVRYADGKYVRVPPRKNPRPPNDGLGFRDWTTHREMPTGRLCLVAYSPYPLASWKERWAEDRRRMFKGMITQIVEDLEKAAPTIAELFAEGQRQAEIRRREYEEYLRLENEKRAAELRAAALKQSREQLLNIVDAWKLATGLEEFFAEATRRASALDAGIRDAALARVARARQLFAGMDPLRHLEKWQTPEERVAAHTAR